LDKIKLENEQNNLQINNYELNIREFQEKLLEKNKKIGILNKQNVSITANNDHLKMS